MEKERLQQMWELFVKKGTLHPDLNPVIKKSWTRSRENNVDPFRTTGTEKLSTQRLEQRLQERRELIAISLPLMEALYSLVKGSGFLVVLCDEQGYLLKVIGDPEPLATAVSTPEYKVVPITGIRKTIAQRMTESLATSAQLTETAWADVTLLDEERKRAETKLTWNDLILFATVKALKKHPNINAHVFDEIHQYEKIHLGIAVDTEESLYVPVIKNAEELSLVQLATQARSLADKAKERRLAASELSGATFTVTNLGSYGIQFFTPIINRPEVAILGVGKIETDLVFQERQIVERKRLPLSLTFDHRAIDGAPAARFLQTVIVLLKEPSRLLDEILAK